MPKSHELTHILPFREARISMLNKDTHQRHESQLAHNIKCIVTPFYAILRCVTKFKGESAVGPTAAMWAVAE